MLSRHSSYNSSYIRLAYNKAELFTLNLTDGGWNSSSCSCAGRDNSVSGHSRIQLMMIMDFHGFLLIFLWSSMVHYLTEQETGARSTRVLGYLNHIWQLRKGKPSGLLHREEERFGKNLTVGLEIGMVGRHILRIRNIWKAHWGGVLVVCFGRWFLGRGWRGWRRGSDSWRVVLAFWVLEMAELVLASWFPVLEPVEDVGVTDLTVLLQLSSDLPYLVSWRVHHAGVENCFKYANLLRLRIPPWLWLRRAFFTPSNWIRNKDILINSKVS